jgi:hypothetical protein
MPDTLLEKITAALHLDIEELTVCSCGHDHLTKALCETISKLDDVQKCELLKQASMMLRFGENNHDQTRRS